MAAPQWGNRHTELAGDEGKITMKVIGAGSTPSLAGSASSFTGTVRRDPLFDPGAPSRMSGSSVTFEPGARTAWHTHPVGQVLLITAGFGSVQSWEQPLQHVRPGDVVWIEAGEKHWHGACAHTSMTHIAITEAVDGSAVEWLEHVTEQQFSSST